MLNLNFLITLNSIRRSPNLKPKQNESEENTKKVNESVEYKNIYSIDSNENINANQRKSIDDKSRHSRIISENNMSENDSYLF